MLPPRRQPLNRLLLSCLIRSCTETGALGDGEVDAAVRVRGTACTCGCLCSGDIPKFTEGGSSQALEPPHICFGVFGSACSRLTERTATSREPPRLELPAALRPEDMLPFVMAV